MFQTKNTENISPSDIATTGAESVTSVLSNPSTYEYYLKAYAPNPKQPGYYLRYNGIVNRDTKVNSGGI